MTGGAETSGGTPAPTCGGDDADFSPGNTGGSTTEGGSIVLNAAGGALGAGTAAENDSDGRGVMNSGPPGTDGGGPAGGGVAAGTEGAAGRSLRSRASIVMVAAPSPKTLAVAQTRMPSTGTM